MSKYLVAYFSASGTTRKVAKRLAAAAKADCFEIVPAIPYTDADLNWRDQNSRSSVEMRDGSFRPELAPQDFDVSRYDTILLGFPIWWYVAPTIINAFLERHDFGGKRIVLFATSGGSGFGETVRRLAPSAPGARIEEGRLLNGVSDKQLSDWLKAL